MPTSDATTPSRRRQRVDSESSTHDVFALPSQSLKPSSKRHKSAASPGETAASSAAMLATAARAAGKAREPEIIDLTRRGAFQPFNGAKKLTIKNLQTRPRTEQIDEYYRKTWAELRAALDSIFAGQQPAVPLEKLYRGTEDVCRHGESETLYDMLKRKCEGRLVKVVESIRVDKSKYGEKTVLESVRKHWDIWNRQTALIRSAFSYLDRAFLLKHATLLGINDLTIMLFRRMIFAKSGPDASTTLGADAVENLLEQIYLDRTRDGYFDEKLLKEAVMMFHVMGVYGKHVEPAILRDSSDFFLHFGQDRSAAPLKDYIHATQKLLRAEDFRCNAFNFDSSTKKALLEDARSILIDQYSEKLLDSGSVAKLLDGNDFGSLKALYELLHLSGKQLDLIKPFREYIVATGGAIISDKARDEDMVIRLLELRRALDLIVRDAFGKDDAFHKALRDAFGVFMNDDKAAKVWDLGRDKVAEMIAKYIDLLLRGGIKALPKNLLSDNKDRAEAEQSGVASTGDEDAELDRQLNQALELFRHLGTKDTFEAFYKKDLARRLLMGRSASQDAERNMLAKFKVECGHNFTRNLEQMFKDQELGKEEMAAYRQMLEHSEFGGSPVDLQVMVLQQVSWPTYPAAQLRIPPAIAKQLEHFDKYYQSKHTGRILTWVHGLAHCVVKASFPKGTKELLVSAFQAVVLLLFNDVPAGGALAYGDISTATGLAGGDLDRTLQSLACGKARVLAKHPKGKEVASTDTFSVNKVFADAKYRVKINQIQLKETKEENRATHERVAQDRRFETQAAIVRIMKSRKRMTHAELVAEVINMTKSRGSVDAQAIKKEIETLIEKDYLERDADEKGIYNYLA